MNIRNRLRELLTEAKKEKSFGCIMLYFKYDKAKWKEIQDLIDEDDLYVDENDDSYGREDNPHCTILYGLPSDIENEKVEEKIDAIKNPKIKVGKVSSFDNDKFDVLKFEIVGDEIYAINKDFAKLPHTNSFKYEPHCTIAYLKKGKVEEYIKKFNDSVEFEFTNDKIVYSKTDGNKVDYKL